MGDDARGHFDQVLEGLDGLQVPYDIDTRLVRGLDYYTRTVFEALADTGLGAQNAVAAGGRYDGLVEQLGGRPTPAIGWAAGVERLLLLCAEQAPPPAPRPPQLMLIGADDEGRALVSRLAHHLRGAGIYVEVDHRGRSVKAQMKRADRSGARHVLVLGERECRENSGQLKNMADGSVQSIELSGAKLVSALTTPAGA